MRLGNSFYGNDLLTLQEQEEAYRDSHDRELDLRRHSEGEFVPRVDDGEGEPDV